MKLLMASRSDNLCSVLSVFSLKYPPHRSTTGLLENSTRQAPISSACIKEVRGSFSSDVIKKVLHLNQPQKTSADRIELAKVDPQRFSAE